MRDWIKMCHDLKIRKTLIKQYEEESKDLENDYSPDDGEQNNLQQFLSFTDRKGPKVKDHSHWNGSYRGACQWKLLKSNYTFIKSFILRSCCM